MERAIKFIKITEKIIHLILQPFKNRSIRVLTDLGISQPIIAKDGIDQGKTISPLLWRIFYDPLLCKIQDNTNLGYTMECKWNKDFGVFLNSKSATQSTLRSRQAAIAFMDDTTWIARSKTDMEKILKDSRSFYIANDLEINEEKSILITINNPLKEPGQILMGKDQKIVTELDRGEHKRFLGVWIGNKSHEKDTISRISKEINTITSTLKNKRVTGKQIE